MNDNGDKPDLENETYDTNGDPEKEKLMKMHEQDVQEFLEEYDETDGCMDTEEHKQQYKKERLTGIGGWLVLMIVIFSLGIFVGALWIVFSLALPSLNIQISEFVRYIVMVPLYSILLITLVKKLWFFPRMYQIVNVILIISVLLTIDGNTAVFAIVTVILYVLWIIYLQLSKRVKYTFIYRWNGEINEKSAAKSSEV